MTPNPAYYLVIDVEATCERGGLMPPKDTEIIEIGAVLVRAGSFAVEGEFQTFIRPVARPRLTPFCTELTSITQADVDRAPTFLAAIAALAAVIGGRDAQRHRAALPFGGRHLNLKALFSEALGESERFGMAGALRRVGLPLEGTHHRGIDDARNIAKILPYALGVAEPKPRRPAWGREPARRA